MAHCFPLELTPLSLIPYLQSPQTSGHRHRQTSSHRHRPASSHRYRPASGHRHRPASDRQRPASGPGVC
ncbi:MAG TPA: hypothetical protein EYN03_04880 [Planctomycetes bacterium]|nr:hypothetical protein [Planctomycetota bacterium]